MQHSISYHVTGFLEKHETCCALVLGGILALGPVWIPFAIQYFQS